MKIQVTPEIQAKTVEELRSFANEYKGIREQMFTEVSNLGSKWQGEDNRVFTEKINAALDSLQLMINALNSSADVIDTERQKYLAQQQAVIDGLK